MAENIPIAPRSKLTLYLPYLPIYQVTTKFPLKEYTLHTLVSQGSFPFQYQFHNVTKCNIEVANLAQTGTFLSAIGQYQHHAYCIPSTDTLKLNSGILLNFKDKKRKAPRTKKQITNQIEFKRILNVNVMCFSVHFISVYFMQLFHKKYIFDKLIYHYSYLSKPFICHTIYI